MSVIIATRVSSSQFYVGGEHDQEYEVGRRIELHQGDAGTGYVSVVQATYSPSTIRTYITVTPYSVTSSLVSIGRGSCGANSVGAHAHTGHGDGGRMYAGSLGPLEVTRLKEFANLTGTMGQVLQTDNQNALSYLPPKFCLSLTAGESLSQYQVVYQDTADDGKCKLAQQDGTATEAEVVGIVISASIALGSVGNVLAFGLITNAAWTWTAGAPLYLSDTPGGMTESKPGSGIVVRCGRAISPTTVLFFPLCTS